jgi:predicted murein hydrolase (TIGR00659 family)
MKPELFSFWVYLSTTPLLGLTLTLCAYCIGLWAAQRAGYHPLVNPVLIAIVLVASALLIGRISFQTYFEGAQFIHFLLGTATVALGVPLYERLGELRKYATPFILAMLGGSVVSTLCAVGILWAFDVPQDLQRTMLSKSVTAPIAMGIAEKVGGIPTLAAVFCVCTGIVGATLGRWVCDRVGVRSHAVRGLALGTNAHGIGTARAYLVSPEMGAYAGLALGLHGVIAALLLPAIIRVLGG